jgi:hypothetical protein
MKSSKPVKPLGRLFAASCIMATFATASTAHASSAPVILDLEGNTTCSSLVANDVIYEAKDNAPPIGEDKTLTLHNGQQLKYTTNGEGDTITEWRLSATTIDPAYPVNFVIVKGTQGSFGAKVFHYGKAGVTYDNDLESPLDTKNDVLTTLGTVTFCYGLDEQTIVEQEVVPRCNADGFTLAGEEIGCGNDVTSFHAITKGDVLTYEECTCRETAYYCDRDVPAGGINSCVPDCTGSEYPYTWNGVTYLYELECLRDTELNETPTGGIEPWNNGSGWCSSFSGSSGCRTW